MLLEYFAECQRLYKHYFIHLRVSFLEWVACYYYCSVGEVHCEGQLFYL